MPDENRTTKAEILTHVTDDGEVLVTLPNGQMKFMGFWQTAKFAWVAIFSGHSVKVQD